MDYKVIINLMKEMNNTDLTKLEIEEEGLRICLEKSAATAPMAQPAIPTVAVASASAAAPVVMQPQITTGTGTATNEAAEKSLDEICSKKVVSPMVGTFYASASPDKPPFVKVGDKVKKGQTICIIEAMKLMNEIECEHDGEIVKILINNEDKVEFGQSMFLIK